jgi:hypothetical protein
MEYGGCPKLFWFELYNRSAEEDEELSVEAAHRIRNGVEAGRRARAYFGAYTLISHHADFSEMARETQAVIRRGDNIIAEASFCHKKTFEKGDSLNISCQTDILRRIGNDTSTGEPFYEITEVKSATGVKDAYYEDCAFQYYTLSLCGITVRRINLLHINNEYVRHGELDIQRLFTLEDITDEVKKRSADVEKRLALLAEAAASDEAPDVPVGEDCLDCPRCVDCGINLPEHNIYSIRGVWTGGVSRWELYQRGIVSFRQIADSGIPLSIRQRQQVEAETERLPPIIDKDAIRAFLDTLRFPLYFLDFETYDEVIPSFDGVHPYQKMPFQYSLHILDAIDGNLTHTEFLADEHEDPRRPCAERLCGDIPADVCVLAYHSGFEKGRITELAEYLPELREHLTHISQNIYDLEIPFRRRHYYCKEMRGSSSIKSVLPALFPDDPELDYSRLEDVNHGGDAMSVFPELKYMAREDVERYRKALLAYCRLDTLAMVRILQKLYSAAA